MPLALTPSRLEAKGLVPVEIRPRQSPVALLKSGFLADRCRCRWAPTHRHLPFRRDLAVRARRSELKKTRPSSVRLRPLEARLALPVAAALVGSQEVQSSRLVAASIADRSPSGRRCHSRSAGRLVGNAAYSPLGVTWKSAVRRVPASLERIEHLGVFGAKGGDEARF